ncbi:Ribonuclease III [Bertholletia excelsa]
MKSFENFETVTSVRAVREIDMDEAESFMSMDDSVAVVEWILNYRFKNKKLLEEALTHSSFPESASYERLEFVGDAALGLAVSNFLFRNYPDVDQGQLTLLRSANVSTEKLARVAVRHGLYNCVRRNAAALDEKVRDFELAVEKEAETVVYRGKVKAPKVLADIVESVSAAVYVDCQFDLDALWKIFKGLLEPIIKLDMLRQHPHPVTELHDLCQKNGKKLEIKPKREACMNIASVYVDGKFVVSASDEKKEDAKIYAAIAALEELLHFKNNQKFGDDICSGIIATSKIGGAKQKLHELCGKKRWPKPSYRTESEVGPAHDKKFICSVKIEAADSLLVVEGHEKGRVKDAQNSAASLMLCQLKEAKYI